MILFIIIAIFVLQYDPDPEHDYSVYLFHVVFSHVCIAI